MIFSIGYQRLPSARRLLDIAIKLDATVIDVRGVPSSRKSGFGGRQLPELLGARYEWWGDRLGNKGSNTTTKTGLESLAAKYFSEKVGPHAILLCVEEAPGECHRHFMIAKRLLPRGIQVRHIYQRELILASELEAALSSSDPDSSYAFEPFDL